MLLKLHQHRLTDRSVRDLVRRFVAVEQVRQIEGLEGLHAHRAEFGHRRREHLHRAELKGLEFLLVLVQLAVRIDLDFDPAPRTLLGQLLEVLGALALGRFARDHVAELDDDGRIVSLGAAHRTERQAGQHPQGRLCSDSRFETMHAGIRS